MSIEDQNTYYSRLFEISCIQKGWDDLTDEPLYYLEAFKEGVSIEKVSNLTEEQLPDELEKLKTKIYLAI